MKPPIHRAAALLACLGLAAGGCVTGGAPPPEASIEPAGSYVIGVPDLLRVSVWKYPELSVDVPVRRDGMISVPLLDDVRAAGRTPEELKEEVARELGRYITRPNVTVIVISPESQTVTVVGGVAQSGPVSLRGRMGVIEAVAATGGFSAWANKGDIRVIRVVDGERISYRVDYGRYLRGDADADMELQPGDVVVVPE